MANQDMNQNTDFLTKQHHYTREKEKADKILARYDLALKIILGFGFGICFPLLMVVMFIGASVPIILLLIVAGGGIIAGAILILKRKKAHKARLEAQMLNTLH